MSRIKYFLVLAPALLLLGCGPMHTEVGVGMAYGGPPPICAYGYYDYAPYNCAPYGYYGPEWFNDGAFIGAGPWFHGPARFRGSVDNHFDEHHYHGTFPRRGEQADRDHQPGHMQNFHGNQRRDGRGHAVHGH
jgi:hypothetical protein